MFPKVNPKQSFPRLEEEIIKFWKEDDTFKKSIETRRESEEFNFYDGPPFATGTPHYGHILAGTIKDVIPRYQTMLGKRVDRAFGWDCHGLPIENIVEKKMGISGKEDIENKIGVYDFNEACRANVFGYVDEWRKTVERMGRWVDMDNDYKTMDASFMESVWWVFKSIYDKGLVYEGHRVVPYCPRCSTPLSNFEVNQGYKDVQNKTVTVKFRVKSDKKCDYKESNGIIVRNEDGKILFGKRKTNGLLTLAGGKLDCGEDPMKSAIRELEEETGIKTDKLEMYTCNYSIHAGVNWKEYVYIFDVKSDIKVGNPEAHKFEHWKFYDINELNDSDMESYDHQIVKQLKGEKETSKFHKDGNKYILAWTTTPWTLYANLGLAVGADIDYVELLDKTNGDTYVLAKEKVKDYYKKPEDYEIMREYKGECLAGIEYEPLFPDFQIQLKEMGKDMGNAIKLGKNAYKVVLGHHVTTETGVGIVHIAPAYGEDDYVIGDKEDLGFVTHIDDTGKTYNLLDKNGKFVFDFNEEVIQDLKERKLSVNIGTIVHSYPHCWRCDTPLVYRAISAWYVAVEKIRDKMVANNLKTNWTPDAIKYGRFGKWLEQARDWNISRNRYWGSAIPVWQSEDKKEEVCIGSIEELYEANKEYGQIEKKDNKYYYKATGKEVDLHKHFVDEIFVKSDKGIKAKKVLAIHGKGVDIESDPHKEKWILTREVFDKNGIILDLPQFDKNPDPTYELWEKTFKTVDFAKYDAIYTRSLGGLMTVKYLSENNIKVKRLVIACPGVSFKTKRGENPNIGKIWDSLTEKSYRNIADEIIVVHAKDDDKVPYESGKDFAEKLDAVFISLDQGNHHLGDNYQLISGLLKYGSPLKRIPEVLDCWFESGSMPYASKHYPFAFRDVIPAEAGIYKNSQQTNLNNEANANNYSIDSGLNPEGRDFRTSGGFKFPADFIAEGLDQTRGWFYTLIILSTALYDSPATMNTIVNGIVLAEDGKKMSKSLKNYPDPQKIFDNYGADAMRYYLMNSPVVEAQDLRFAEAGVEEVVKKVILPLWNTYSFFTTYANIDKYKPSKSHIFFCRHGETTNNANGLMNGGDANSQLTKKGINQAIIAGKNFKINGEKIDVIISSHKDRAVDTAKLIAKEIGYTSEIIIDERFNEIRDGVFLGMTHAEVRKYVKDKFGVVVEGNYETRVAFKSKKYNQVEDVTEFDERIVKAYKEIEEKYKGKNVLIVAHTGSFRPINKYLSDISLEVAHYDLPSIQNATIFKLPNRRQNVLDKWIISELNKLVSDVRNGLDNYRINESTRPITAFMDNLTNWYIRRSRKRFWANGMDSDKIEAYDTLYEVLVELCKIFAPVMPFISDYIYKNLTGKESVHLEIFPNVNKAFILDSLNTSFDKTAKIINLGLASREKAKRRVRQPLMSIKISENLDEYYVNMIKEELNVKTVKVFTEDEMPKKICKPNARLIGPKFGGDVKFILSEAKEGNFEELENGRVKVGEFILEEGEYDIEFKEGNSSFLEDNYNEWWMERGFGMVVKLNTKLTPELIAEGYARDLVRHIQESRKEADFQVEDRIQIQLITDKEEGVVKEVINKFKNYIQEETLSTIVDNLIGESFVKEIELEEFKIKIALKKVS